ncbi:hypothetical protein DPMN_062625 [Dreissena polymorpha]|uniref:Uncharacterized protein n=1 Tax=Dreissena polymorpha TaxID=45954 RepID=A0A9D4C9V5_DREPO|nr:hypothetical protein DPMN_062625 [Dreissena polymorpha]
MFNFIHIMKTDPPPAIITTNVLTKVHEDWTINVTLMILTRKLPALSWQPITNFIMTKFYEDWIINVTSEVLTSNVTSRVKRFLTSCDPVWISTISLDKSKFHKDQTTSVSSRVLTRQNIDDGDRQKVIPKPHHENAVLR